MTTSQTDRNAAVEMQFDADTGIATLTLTMEGRANKINAAFGEGLSAAVEWARTREGLEGVIIASAHKDFCVGADIDMLYGMTTPEQMLALVQGLNRLFRQIETMGVPVVAALTGSALGGGYELALACHRRIALDDARVQVGLPEVGLGVIPGAGGTQRLPRLVGIQAALELIGQGKIVRAPKALGMKLVDELAPDAASLRKQAEAWIAANPKARQPWDVKGFRWPGPRPDSEDGRAMFMVACAMLTKKTAGTMQAPEAVIAAVQDGAAVTFDRALEVETRYFVKLAVSPQAKDMIRTMWFHRTAAERAEGYEVADPGVQRVAILGAGMMGAGLGFLCAQAGWEVALKDIEQEALDAAKAHVEAEAGKRLKHLSAEERAAVVGRIRYTLDTADLAGTDLVIEAVLEDDAVKAKVTREVEPLLTDKAIFASNTSAIPITHLAKASADPDRFIGLHFFSPVEQMPLLEIVVGAKTSDETLARALGIAKKLKKTPIVVNDGYGFYTSRVFAAYLMEGVQLVAEGHDPVLVEWAARSAGMVVPPLKVFDEVTLRLGHHALTQREKYVGEAVDLAGVQLLAKMVEQGRIGKAAGQGFYDYQGKERRLWPGLRDLAATVTDARPAQTGVELIRDRLMLAQVLDVVRCVESGVLRSHRDAEVGAVFGIGFAPSSGGPLAWIDRHGAPWVVERADALAADYGPRFTPPQLLRDMAERGERFFPLPGA